MPAPPRPRRFIRRTIVVLVAAGGLTVAWFLAYGGRYLQHEDPLQKADAIFVLAGSRTERLLEAIDLYKEGYAPFLAVSRAQPETGELLLRKRGIQFPSEIELQRSMLVQSGIHQSAILDTGVDADNTAQEADLLRAMVNARGWRRVIVVTSKYHTRRAGFAFRRGLDGTGAQVIMRATRYDLSDPASWWRRRGDLRFAGNEWLKLIAYRLGLGG